MILLSLLHLILSIMALALALAVTSALICIREWQSSVDVSGFATYPKLFAKMDGSVAEPSSPRPQVVLKPLPQLYIYDHCPFCVRVRLALGLKGVKHELVFMANDDVDTPTALVGKKIAPIFAYSPMNIIMAESLDIIAVVDGNPAFGQPQFLLPFSGRTDLSDWQKKYSDLLRIFQRPRYMKTYLPEFATRDARAAFMRNHPLPGHNQSTWSALSSAEQHQLYQHAFVESQSRYSELHRALLELDDLLASSESVNKEGLSYDDIDLWSRLRSLTLVKDIVWPTKLRKYLEHLSDLGDVPLYFSMAL